MVSGSRSVGNAALRLRLRLKGRVQVRRLLWLSFRLWILVVASDRVHDPIESCPGVGLAFCFVQLGVLPERRLPVEIGVVETQFGLVVERCGLCGEFGLVGVGDEHVPLEIVLVHLRIVGQIGRHGSVLTM